MTFQSPSNPGAVYLSELPLYHPSINPSILPPCKPDLECKLGVGSVPETFRSASSFYRTSGRLSLQINSNVNYMDLQCVLEVALTASCILTTFTVCTLFEGKNTYPNHVLHFLLTQDLELSKKNCTGRKGRLKNKTKLLQQGKETEFNSADTKV